MQSGFHRLLVIVVVLIAAARASVSQELAYDLQGHAVSQLAAPGTRVVVLVFAATDCPISNRYLPEIERLRGEWQTKDVRFWLVFPNAGDAAEVVRKHEREFSITTPSLIDSEQRLVRMAHVSVTPEAAVFTAERGELREVYHGRIDDRYLAFGQERPQATQHDLEDAIRAAIEGGPAHRPAAGPVGCSIVPRNLKR